MPRRPYGARRDTVSGVGALRNLIGLLPRGAAWNTSQDSYLGRLLTGLAAEFDRVEARAADLQREAFPLTADELLREWDAAVALDYPGALTGGFDKDLARAMIAWLLETSTLSRASIERFCALSEIPFAADGDGVTRPLYRLIRVDHTDTHEATIRLLAEGGSTFVEDLLRRRAHATGTLVFDWVVPAIAITSPADESIACDELVTVTGTSTGVGTVQVVVTESGGFVTTYTTTADSGTGEWSVQIALATYLDGEDTTIVARGYTGIVTAAAGWVESTPVVVTSEFGVSVYFSGPLTTTEIFPTFTGTATPGSTIVIELRGDTEAPVVADVNGDWSVEMENQGLDLGTNELTIYVTGPAPCEHEDSIVVQVERESSGTSQVWDDLTALAGWTFSRSSVATDGAPETGLPADDVDDYAVDVVREVSAKLGLSGQPAYLLEGQRTNYTRYTDDLVNAAKWGSIGSPTRTGGQSDPKGGSTALRIESAVGTNFVNGTCAASSNALHAASIYKRQGSGSGAWQATHLNPIEARGGTAASAWSRTRWAVTTTATSGWRLNESADRASSGGVAAGARDAVLWGPQVEQGAFASSFIDNALATAATRATDNARCTLPTSWCADVLTVEYRPEHSSGEHVTHAAEMSLIDDGARSLSLVVDAGSSKVRLVTSGGTYTSPALTYSSGDVVRIEVDWAGLTLDVSVNAAPVAQTPIAGSWSSGGTAYIGRNSGGTTPAFGVISIGGVR